MCTSSLEVMICHGLCTTSYFLRVYNVFTTCLQRKARKAVERRWPVYVYELNPKP